MTFKVSNYYFDIELESVVATNVYLTCSSLERKQKYFTCKRF